MRPALSTLVRERMDEFSDAERRVARELLADYPAAGLASSHALARAAGVSAPTVVRFAARLGCSGFSDLQQRLREEISESGSSPVERTVARGVVPGHADSVTDAMRRRSDAIEQTLHLVPRSELEGAADLLAATKGRVLVAGGFFSESVARIMALQLSQVRPDVVFVAEPLRREAGMLLDARKRSVLVVFDLRRYEPAALELCQRAKASGLDVVLVTDRWMSPASAKADAVLCVEVEAIPFDTFAAVIALAEVLVAMVLARGGEKSLQRMRQWEAGAVSHTRTARSQGVQNERPGSAGRPTSEE